MVTGLSNGHVIGDVYKDCSSGREKMKVRLEQVQEREWEENN